jgi:hypothetical protein
MSDEATKTKLHKRLLKAIDDDTAADRDKQEAKKLVAEFLENKVLVRVINSIVENSFVGNG